ncbi:hypothetical protein [Nocardioides sp. NPDC006273]|uniref:hypothetical protein n=1 Tax=Nocardioides sp. NPDC006273 TaxID=3155598 RepID=UPI0033AAC095
MSPERFRPPWALVAGWFNFLHGEATAGDQLAGDAVWERLRELGIDHDAALSPGLRRPCLVVAASRAFT